MERKSRVSEYVRQGECEGAEQPSGASARPTRRYAVVLAAVLLVFTVVFPARADESIRLRPPPDSAEDLPSIFDLQFTEPEKSSVRFDNLLEKSSLDLHLRNFYFNRAKPDALDSVAWAQGGSLEYETGKVWGVFSVAAEYFASLPLYAPEEHDGTLLLEPGQDDIEVLGVANSRFEIGDNVLSLYRQKYDLPYVNQQDNRMVPNTFEGYTIGMPKASSTRFQYIAGYIDRIKKRESDDFISMSDAAGVKSRESGLIVAGARVFPMESISLAAINFYLEDVFNLSYGEVVHKTSVTESISNSLFLQISDQRSVGDDLLRGEEYTATMWGIKEAVSYRHAVLITAFNQVDAGALMRSPFGSYPGYTSSMVEDFNRAGESSWLLGISYDFSRLGLEDLSVSAYYISGSGAVDESTKADLADRSETDVTIDYRVSEGVLKGLWVRLRSATVDEDGKDNLQDYRVVVNYEFAMYHPAEE